MGGNTPMHAFMSIVYTKLNLVRMLNDFGKARVCIPCISEEFHYLFRFTK